MKPRARPCSAKMRAICFSKHCSKAAQFWQRTGSVSTFWPGHARCAPNRTGQACVSTLQFSSFKLSWREFLQFSDFLAPLSKDIQGTSCNDIDKAERRLVRRLRKKWIVQGQTPPEDTLQSLPPCIMGSILAVGDDGVLKIGTNHGTWSHMNATNAIAARIGGTLHRCPKVKSIYLSGEVGGTCLESIRTIHDDVGSAFAPELATVSGGTVAARPSLAPISSVTSLRLQHLEVDVSSGTIPWLTREMTRFPQLVSLTLHQMHHPQSQTSRRSMLAAGVRERPGMLWSGLSRLTSLTSLDVSTTRLDQRCAAGLACAIYKLKSLKKLRADDIDGSSSLLLHYTRLPDLESLDITASRCECCTDCC